MSDALGSNDPKIGQIIARAWSDEAFKQRLIADPKAVLQEYGVQMPANLNLKVVENSNDLHHFVLPPAPQELTDEDLDKVAGGWKSMQTNSAPPCEGRAGCASYPPCQSDG